MYGYIPPSNNAYLNNYNYGQQPPYAQNSIYNQRPPYNYQNPVNNYNNYNNNNNNQRIITSYQPLALSCALEQSNYSPYGKKFIKKFLLSDYLENKEAKVYFQNKLFVIEHTLSINFLGKSYKINMFIHIPMYFPEGRPEFYLQKKANVGLNKSYLDGRINQETFLINIDRFGPYDPNNIKEVIKNIVNEFNKDFPIYKENKKAPSYGPQEIYGKNNINKNTANEVIIESDTFTDEQFLNFIRKQTKDKVREKFVDFNNKFKFEQNHKELKNLNGILKMKSDSSNNSDINNSPMGQELEKLKRIKNDISSIENNLQQEIIHLQNENKTAFQKCDEFIKIRDQKDMEYVVMKKTIEDYLVFLRKGFEKKIVSLEDMINKTRALSMELFSIDYLRKQRKTNYY